MVFNLRLLQCHNDSKANVRSRIRSVVSLKNRNMIVRGNLSGIPLADLLVIDISPIRGQISNRDINPIDMSWDEFRLAISMKLDRDEP